MNFFNIKDNTKDDLCNAFYITQAVYLFTDLSMSDGRGRLLYPNKAEQVQKMHQEIANELEKYGIKVEKAAKPKKDPNVPDFLQGTENLYRLQVILVYEDEVIQPPENLHNAIRAFEARVIPYPWN
ncbi:hypothetical protein OCF84_21500 (plasmid) [Shewanella xiamenensis]|uniref:Uncharacterized protein n=1 Tax=Shewanella xiamenensis TaxID=332186 RepID=A0ABT6UDK1_9GAMM|nr:hypothetical protein [Shewanella xiamenensis]MDI5832547.1 hypothetical protein [Shewanella xiamenensis]WHF57835.1 hypothetical protein OCF84_21500 [Shewanella xiamenensis]